MSFLILPHCFFAALGVRLRIVTLYAENESCVNIIYFKKLICGGIGDGNQEIHAPFKLDFVC